MKRLLIAWAALLVFSSLAQAQPFDAQCCQMCQMGQGMMNMPMQGMPEQEMMMPGMMMQMMSEMMDMQEKMIMGVKPGQRKEMLKRLSMMKDKMGSMMSGKRGQRKGRLKAQVRCAEEWLKKAIALHEVHIKDPKTATDASQMEMMEQMKKAYECITGSGSQMGEIPLDETETGGLKTEVPPKTDPHSH